MSTVASGEFDLDSGAIHHDVEFAELGGGALDGVIGRALVGEVSEEAMQRGRRGRTIDPDDAGAGVEEGERRRGADA